MKRTYFPGITDIVVVTDPIDIRTISNDSRFDRDFIVHGPIRNVKRLRKMLRVFSLDGRLFPTVLPRANTGRAAAQDERWSRLNVKADEVKHGPEQLELKGAKIQFRHGSGANPELSIRIAQTRLRMPELQQQ
jgi:hypothetical protein